MKFNDDTIFIEVKFTDSDGTNYGTIETSEIDGETYVFIPGSLGEIYPNVLEEANRIIKFFNNT